MTDDYPNAGYDDFLDAIAAGEPHYLECASGHGHLPPRRVCPDCGSRELSEEPLPDAGEVVTYTVTHVATPDMTEDTPYVTAVVDFGPVRVTGQTRGIDHGDVEVGTTVSIDLDHTVTADEPVVVFRPR